jgi:hypothetical protein
MRPHVDFLTNPGLFVTPRAHLRVYPFIAHIPDRSLNV